MNNDILLLFFVCKNFNTLLIKKYVYPFLHLYILYTYINKNGIKTVIFPNYDCCAIEIKYILITTPTIKPTIIFL